MMNETRVKTATVQDAYGNEFIFSYRYSPLSVPSWDDRGFHLPFAEGMEALRGLLATVWSGDFEEALFETYRYEFERRLKDEQENSNV